MTVTLKHRFIKSKSRKRKIKEIVGGLPSRRAPKEVSTRVPIVEGVPIVKGVDVSIHPKSGSKANPNIMYAKNARSEAVNREAVREAQEAQEALEAQEAQANVETAAQSHTCPTKSVMQLQESLKKIGITSFASKEEAKAATTTDMQQYDKTAKKTQLFENAVRLLHVVGCAVPLVSSLAEVTLAVVTGVSNFNKSKALTHLASQCLSYVANISTDLSEMFAFYSNPIVIQNKITINNTLYGVLQKNLYTFLYFLIDSITFEITENVGPQHYLYWLTFISKVDFSRASDYSLPIPSTSYRYSCKECIPSETLRNKMISSLDKNLVTLDTPKLGIYKRVKSVFSLGSANNKKQTAALLGFCNDDYMALCKNYNDNIMRLIELNMYILINSAYNNKSLLPILKHSDKALSAEFSNAVFSKTKINEVEKDRFEKQFSALRLVIGAKHIKPFKPDLEVSFKFLIELNRIISELEYPRFTVKPSNNNRFTKGALNVAKGTVNFITKPVNTFFSTPKLQYEELMREYTLMTGNFLTMTSRFTLDYNKLGVIDKERVYIQVTNKLKSVESALNVVKGHLIASANNVGIVADGMSSEGDAVTTSNEVSLGAKEGGRNHSKKKYKYSKKCKTKCNKRKRCAF
jgi:hypothetical protein